MFPPRNYTNIPKLLIRFYANITTLSLSYAFSNKRTFFLFRKGDICYIVEAYKLFIMLKDV